MESAALSPPPLRIAISSCLLGNPVRYDAGHKHNAYITQTLGEYFEFVPFCPEVAIGLGIPRPPIRLVSIDGSIRVRGVNNPQQDVTGALIENAEAVARQLRNVSGYLFKTGSPSCGMKRVKVYHAQSGHPLGSRPGMFAATIMRAHDEPSYRELGRLVAGAGEREAGEAAGEYIRVLMRALSKIATAKQHANVLMHIMGFFKADLDSDDKAELLDLIDAYRQEQVPLIVPMTLIHHHLRVHPNDYLSSQTYINPHPGELMLRNRI